MQIHLEEPNSLQCNPDNMAIQNHKILVNFDMLKIHHFDQLVKASMLNNEKCT